MTDFGRKIVVLCVIAQLAAVYDIDAAPHALIGAQAPELRVKEWYNLKSGEKTPRISDYSGKVVYIFCYQSWCPGCHSRGFPAVKKVSDAFEGSDDIVFLVVQTVFEGFGTNTADKIEKTRSDYALDLPFGHDDGGGKGSLLMRDYRSRGTPWHIIIDASGKIIFCDFHIDADKTISVLKNMIPG